MAAYAEVRDDRNQPPREVCETIGLVEWTKMGNLEEEIKNWKTRWQTGGEGQASTEVSGETKSENVEED